MTGVSSVAADSVCGYIPMWVEGVVPVDTVMSFGGARADGDVLARLPRGVGLSDDVWLCVALLAVLTVSMFLMGLYKRQYLFRLRGFISAPNSRKVVYDKDSRGVWGTVLFWVIVVFAHAVFLSIVADRFAGVEAVRECSAGFIAVMSACVAVSFVMKYLLFLAGGHIFDIQGRVSFFSEGYFMLVFIQGIVLLPLSMVALYAAPPVDGASVFVGLTVMIVVGVLVAVHAVRSFFSGGLSLLYIFLYLCTVEYLPVLIFVKALLTL